MDVLEAAVNEMVKKAFRKQTRFLWVVVFQGSSDSILWLEMVKPSSVGLIAALPPGFNIEASDMAKVYCRKDWQYYFFFLAQETPKWDIL